MVHEQVENLVAAMADWLVNQTDRLTDTEKVVWLVSELAQQTEYKTVYQKESLQVDEKVVGMVSL